MPTAGYQSTDPVEITATYQYGRFELTGPSIKSSKKTSFAAGLSFEMQGLEDDVIRDMGRQSYGEGLGILAETGLDSCASSIFLKNRWFGAGQPGARYILKGQEIEMGTATVPAEISQSFTFLVNVVTIAGNSAVTTDSGTSVDVIAVTASVDTITACKMYVFNHGAGGAGVETKGLRAIVDDQTASNCYGLSGGMYNNDTIFAIDRGVVTGFNGYVDGNTGVERVIDSYLLQRVSSEVEKRGGKQWDVAFGEYQVVDALLDSVRGDRRFMTQDYDAGGDVTFNGRPIVRDLLAPYNELFLLHKPSINWYIVEPLGFADDDGSILHNVSGYDKYEGFIRQYHQLGPAPEAAPFTNGVIRDLKMDL